MSKNLKISKLDAVRRQLETAIRLYFSNGDPVSIHTLAAAAYNITRDINKKMGSSPLLIKELFLKCVREGHEEEVRKKLNEAENFFKHAERDHQAVIDFNPELSEMFVLEACSAYYKLRGEFPPLFKLFQSWFIANHQDLFSFPDEQARVVTMVGEDVIQLGREGYFNKFLPLLSQLNT